MASIEEITNQLRGVDSFAAIEFLSREPDAVAAARAFADASAHYYWKEKNLAESVMLGRAGVQYALSAADRAAAADPALAAELRGRAKAMAYNLASFTWPGWDEPGIAITPSDLVVGRDAAKANLRLGQELNCGPLPMSRAHWMLAGHWLAAAEYGLARDQFVLAAEQAKAAGAEADVLLSEGFEILTNLVASPENEKSQAADALRSRLDDILTRLRPLQDGAMFVGQIETARRVFPLPAPGRGRGPGV